MYVVINLTGSTVYFFKWEFKKTFMDNFPWIPCQECGSQDPWNLKFQISIMDLQSRNTYMAELQAPQESNFQNTMFEVSCQSFQNYLTSSLPQISAWNSFYNQLLLIWNWLKEDCKKMSHRRNCHSWGVPDKHFIKTWTVFIYKHS